VAGLATNIDSSQAMIEAHALIAGKRNRLLEVPLDFVLRRAVGEHRSRRKQRKNQGEDARGSF
jgi:hypothetical protein